MKKNRARTETASGLHPANPRQCLRANHYNKHIYRFYQYTYVSIYRELKAAQQQTADLFEDLFFDRIELYPRNRSLLSAWRTHSNRPRLFSTPYNPRSASTFINATIGCYTRNEVAPTERSSYKPL